MEELSEAQKQDLMMQDWKEREDRLREILRQDKAEKKRREEAERDAMYERLAKARRWNAKHKGRVTHSQYGSIVVPSASKYSAICCAADVWRCDPYDIIGSTVFAAEDEEEITYAE